MKRRAVVVALLALVSACNLIIDRDVVQCRTTADCEARGGAFKRSVCLDTVCRGALACADGTPLPREDRNTAINQRVKFIGLDLRPLPGVKVLVCPQQDSKCPDAPLRTYTTDAAGFIDAEVPSGFAGTFEVHETPPGFPPDFITTVLHTRRFLTVSDPEGSEQAQATRLVTRSAVDGALSLAGKPPADPAKGMLFGAVFDCNQQPLAGATVEMVGVPGGVEPGVTRFYSSADGLPTPNEQVTSSSGIFGFTNIDVPPTGSRNIALRAVVRNADGADLQWSKFEVAVARERLTTVGVRYSP